MKIAPLIDADVRHHDDQLGFYRLAIMARHLDDVLAPMVRRVFLEETPVDDESDQRQSKTQSETDGKANARVVTFLGITCRATRLRLRSGGRA